MAKRRPKRKHAVEATLHVPGLSKAGTSLKLKIFAKGLKRGELVLGRGSLSWFGVKRKTGQEISWSRFAKMMDELAYGTTRSSAS